MKDTAMKHFGTVQSFNEATGHGFISPEEGGRDLSFDRSEILWDPLVSPKPGVRLSYRLSGRNGHASAVDLRTVLSPQRVSAPKSFSIFRTAAEEVATKAQQDEWDNEGGQSASL
jgi:cold shock CspA family protein